MFPNAILIDAGGVLLDEGAYEVATARSIIRVLGNVSPGYGEKEYRQDLEDSIAAFSPRNRRFVIWKHCGNDTALFDALWSEFKTEWKTEEPPLSLMDGIDTELMNMSKEFELVLAGQYGAALVRLLEEHALAGLFVNRLTQDDFEITKPDPRYLQRIAEAAGFSGPECIMIGDRIDKDVIPAKQNGMGTVFVRTGVYRNQKPRTPDEIPDLTLTSVKGMADAVIKKWKPQS